MSDADAEAQRWERASGPSAVPNMDTTPVGKLTEKQLLLGIYMQVRLLVRVIVVLLVINVAVGVWIALTLPE